MSRSNFWLLILGIASTFGYAAAYALGDLRQNTLGFVIIFFTLFLFYLTACALILRPTFQVSKFTFYTIAIFAIIPRLLLLPTRPTLSDDMFRYVWDGRVQGHGFSPYRYPPEAKEVTALRMGDTAVWKYINRKPFVTIYPPGAQIAFAAIWRIVGDSVTGFKAAFVFAELAGALLLIQLLRALHQPAARVLIYLWSPLLIFEVAHAGHVDGLILPLLILTFWARVKERHWLLGAALALATLVKLLPLILLPALLPLPETMGVSGVPSTHDFPSLKPALKTMIAFGFTIALGYLPYNISGDAIGFLPRYFNENFNMGIARLLFDFAKANGLSGPTLANVLTFGGLAGLSILFILKPAADPLRRCVWLIGWFTLFTQNLFAWYLLWLLPLIAVLINPGKLFGFRLAPMTAWLIFSGTIALSYIFFIKWRVNDFAQVLEFAPLYVVLLASGVRQLRLAMPWSRARTAAQES